MKPLKSELQDAETLRQLGSASVQIVHDLKNQMNGLKLYATFLKKRLEKSERPADELETIGKIIAGLERAAGDMTILVRYGRPLDLRRQPKTDLGRLLAVATAEENLEIEGGQYEGDFDPELLGEALKNITSGSRERDGSSSADAVPKTRLRRNMRDGEALAIIEWQLPTVKNSSEDVFEAFTGGRGLRMALAARIIRAHGGDVEQDRALLRARLPLS